MIPVKILIVDDEDFILEEVSETLTDEGYECFLANSVRAAVEIIDTTQEIALILTDLKMPRETGADLINIVEAKFGSTIKFIVMSGHGNPTIGENGINLESYPFLRKPLDIEELIEKIGVVLSGKE
jgi:DNA-binding NtrC family response regulator